MDGGEKTAMSETTLEPHLDHYLRVNTSIRSNRTRDHYRRSLYQFSLHLGRPAHLHDLNDDALAAWMLSTVDGGLTETTANQRAKQILALWNWLARRRVVERFPTVKSLAEPEPMPEAWTADELHRLFDACTRQTGWIGPHLASTWWTAIHHWWWATAERTEATMLLERSWLDLPNQLARVYRGVRKGRMKPRVYRLTPRLCELLEQMLLVPSPSGLVFDHNWASWNGLYKRYRSLLKDAGITYVRGKTVPKKMRITVYSMMQASGSDPLLLSKHSSRKVLEHYIDEAMILAHNKGTWPPQESPEEKPKNWRNGWGLIG